jgi:MSHA biogenesis protein MshP
MRSMRNRRSERGFLVIAAVFLLVVLAGLVGYMMTVSTTSQSASAADFNSARAYQAARAGLEVAAFQVLRSSTCTATQNIAFPANLSGYTATVTCSSSTASALTEGGVSVTAYTLVSKACNDPVLGACPNTTTTSAGYAERELSLTLTK